MIHLNYLFIYFNIKNTKIHSLTPKGQRPFLSKNTSKLPFLTQEAQTEILVFFAFLTKRSCPRLLEEHVQKVLQKLTSWMGKEKFFSLLTSKKRNCPFFAKKQVYCHNFWMESPFWRKIVFPHIVFISPHPLKFSKNHDQKQSYNCVPMENKPVHSSHKEMNEGI